MSALRSALVGGLTYERAFHTLNGRDLARYLALWEMSAWRAHGRAGRRQDKFRDLYGLDALERRRAAVRRIIASIVERWWA